MIQPEILISDANAVQQITEAIEAFNARDLDRWTRFYAEDALHYQPSLAEPFRGRAAIREDYRTSTRVVFQISNSSSCALWAKGAGIASRERSPARTRGP